MIVSLIQIGNKYLRTYGISMLNTVVHFDMIDERSLAHHFTLKQEAFEVYKIFKNSGYKCELVEYYAPDYVDIPVKVQNSSLYGKFGQEPKTISKNKLIEFIVSEGSRFKEYPEVISILDEILKFQTQYETNIDYQKLIEFIENKKSGKLGGVAIYINRSLDSLKQKLKKEYKFLYPHQKQKGIVHIEKK